MTLAAKLQPLHDRLKILMSLPAELVPTGEIEKLQAERKAIISGHLGNEDGTDDFIVRSLELITATKPAAPEVKDRLTLETNVKEYFENLLTKIMEYSVITADNLNASGKISVLSLPVIAHAAELILDLAAQNGQAEAIELLRIKDLIFEPKKLRNRIQQIKNKAPRDSDLHQAISFDNHDMGRGYIEPCLRAFYTNFRMQDFTYSGPKLAGADAVAAAEAYKAQYLQPALPHSDEKRFSTADVIKALKILAGQDKAADIFEDLAQNSGAEYGKDLENLLTILAKTSEQTANYSLQDVLDIAFILNDSATRATILAGDPKKLQTAIELYTKIKDREITLELKTLRRKNLVTDTVSGTIKQLTPKCASSVRKYLLHSANLVNYAGADETDTQVKRFKENISALYQAEQAEQRDIRIKEDIAAQLATAGQFVAGVGTKAYQRLTPTLFANEAVESRSQVEASIIKAPFPVKGTPEKSLFELAAAVYILPEAQGKETGSVKFYTHGETGILLSETTAANGKKTHQVHVPMLRNQQYAKQPLVLQPNPQLAGKLIAQTQTFAADNLPANIPSDADAVIDVITIDLGSEVTLGAVLNTINHSLKSETDKNHGRIDHLILADTPGKIIGEVINGQPVAKFAPFSEPARTMQPVGSGLAALDVIMTRADDTRIKARKLGEAPNPPIRPTPEERPGVKPDTDDNDGLA